MSSQYKTAVQQRGVNACTVDSKVTVGALINIAKIVVCCRCDYKHEGKCEEIEMNVFFSKNNDQL